MSKPLIERVSPRAQEQSHGDLRLFKAMIQKAAEAEHLARGKQDVREYASFIPRHAVIKVGAWPKL